LFAYLKGARRSELLSAGLFGLSCLVRPEGLLFSGITLLHLLIRDRRRAVRWACLWVSLVIPLVLWRRAYYGEWVPNTFFAKTGGGLRQVSRGVGYLKSFLNEYGRIGLFFLAVLPFLRGRVDWRRSYQLTALAPYLVYVAYTGGDWIPHFRLIVPVLPLLFAVLGEGISTVVRPLLEGRGSWRSSRIAILLVLLGLLVFDVANQSYYLHMGTELWAKGYRHAHRFVGDWLRHEAPESGPVALMDIGIVSYYSERDIIDITGLTEPWIAHAPGGWLKKTYPVARLLALKPAYVVLVSRGELASEGFSSSFPIDQRIFDDPGFRDSYQFLFARDAFYAKEPHDFGYYLNVFERQ
jgi:arabinofuranosyltransferase